MKAVALLPKAILTRPLHDWFVSHCAKAGIELESHDVSEDCGSYTELFRRERNVITWNCRMPHSWTQQNGQNVLYLDNSLISQRSGVYVDRGGMLHQSHLSRLETWRHVTDYPCEFYATREFGSKAFSGGDPKGPILICLQCEKDSNVQQGFRLGLDQPDKTATFLGMVAEHLPKGREVLIRPHPRMRDQFDATLMRPGWKLNLEGKLVEVLPNCSAMVTINSTCTHEAILLGVPVATLGLGVHTNAGVTLECGTDPSRLRDISSWTPEPKRARQYVSACMTRHFLPYDILPTRENEEFNLWIKATQ